MVRTSIPLVFACTGALAPAQTPLTTIVVATGLDRPVWLGSPPGDRTRLFAVEQHLARVRIVENGTLLAQPFLDLSGQVATADEQGLLGLAFHPRHASNGLFFVDYTRRSDGATVIARYSVSATNRNLADAQSAMTLFVLPQPNAWHNGGCLAFGPDGYLYIARGDGGDGTNGCPSQAGNTLRGKMLRIDVDSGSPYGIPPSNPFVHDPNVLDEIWQSGLRNPWRFSFDRLTGDLYLADVGWNTKEEVSFQPRASGGGVNWGWPVMEGTTCYYAGCGGPPCNDPRLKLPIHEYTHAGGNCCIIGGHVYRGCAVPDLQGSYFFADLCSARIWSFRYAGNQLTGFRERTAELNPAGALHADDITTFGEDAAGELYFTGNNGRVFQVVPQAPAPATNCGFGQPGGNGLRPSFTACGILWPGQWADFTLRSAPAGTLALLLLSTQNQPLVLPVGTVVPVPVLMTAAFVTSSAGEVTFRIPGGAGRPGAVYGQFAMLDPGVVSGIGLSNALRIDFP